MDIWSKTPFGFCTEMSTLSANGNPPIPVKGKTVRFPMKKGDLNFGYVVRNNDGDELISWIVSVDGYRLEVFND